jgi:predicted alpha/beta-hydrolase family hydrolase
MGLRLFLGHGASGTAASMAPFVEGLRARGVDAAAIDLPKRKAEDALPAFHGVVPSERDVAVGGHSYGGRVASLAAAEPDAPYAALVCFSYPLHPPGGPERTDARIAHWPAIRCPVLLLSGESDPFARIDLLRASVGRLARAELVTYPRLGHTLKPVLDDVLDRVAAFLSDLPERRS